MSENSKVTVPVGMPACFTSTMTGAAYLPSPACRES